MATCPVCGMSEHSRDHQLFCTGKMETDSETIAQPSKMVGWGED